MTALRVLAGGVTGQLGDGFEVGFVAEDGVERRILLRDAWSMRFERCLPVRRFPSYKGQKHYPGRWWSATMGAHVGFESWLERDKTRSHAPDYFARLHDGNALVVDCRPVERIKPKDAAIFEVTRTACEQVGWRYRLVGATDAILTANVRWLAGYRHPRHDVAPVAAALREACAAPLPLMTAAEAVGDPIAVLPVLFHLLWRHELDTDLSTPLHPDAVITLAVN